MKAKERLWLAPDLGPISGPHWLFPFSICIFPQVEKLRNNLSREIPNVFPIYPRRDFCLSIADSLIYSFIHSPILPSFMFYYKWGTYIYSCISSNNSGKLHNLLNFSKMKSKVSHLSHIYIYIYIHTHTHIYIYISVLNYKVSLLPKLLQRM